MTAARRRAAALAAALVVAAAGFALLRRPPARPPLPCPHLAAVLAVPSLEAAPVLLARLSLPGGVCRIAAAAEAADTAPLAVLPGDAFRPASAARTRWLPFLLVAQRAASLLVARAPVAPHFLWHSLSGQTVVLSPAAGDLGGVVVTAMVAVHAVDGVALLRGLGERAFVAGTGAYAELPLWPAEALLLAGRAHPAADLAIQGGPLPAAVLAARPAFARRHPRLLAAIAVAVYGAELRLDRLGGRLADAWPTPLAPAARRALAAALARARYAGVWPSDPRLDAALFTRLDVLLQGAGLVPVGPPPAALAWPAEAAMRRLAPVPQAG
ncbi:MAG: hypothetical protein K6V73_00850 [Firmicutes bacterium]|nr:hypothetical protein [Bacillota bacterium]